jgi:hypothetical protein
MSNSSNAGGIGCAGEILLTLILFYVLFHLDPIVRFLDRLVGS